MEEPIKELIQLFCPVCGEKTSTRLYPDSVLLHFPLHCPHCDKDYPIDVVDGKLILRK